MRKIATFFLDLVKKTIRRPGRRRVFVLSGEQLASVPISGGVASGQAAVVNDLSISDELVLGRHEVFPYENLVDARTFRALRKHPHGDEKASSRQPSLGQKEPFLSLWEGFIERSLITADWRYGGFHHCGFILEKNRWTLPSWIWTNAAIIRSMVRTGRTEEAVRLGELFLSHQQEEGGWIVRFQPDRADGLAPILAPNDSAYIASNGLIPIYLSTGDERFLRSALHCASWIMNHGHRDHLVLLGLDSNSGKWITDTNIVDVGFTADLFCALYDVGAGGKYLDFARRFIDSYLRSFYIGGGRFAAAVDRNGRKRGTGVFGRGQAWALEGLIPFYCITGDEKVKEVIDATTEFMLNAQRPEGAWHHVIRPGQLQWFSADDSKGTPVIAATLDRWSTINREYMSDVKSAVNKATRWCMKHTERTGEAAGGIFSWNPEGAVVYEHNTSVAFVYSNCYLGELVRRHGDLAEVVMRGSD